MNRVERQTAEIQGLYTIYNDNDAELVEYIEYIDKPDKGYRVESKSLNSDTIERLDKFLGLKLVTVHPTWIEKPNNRAVMATYHFKEVE